MLSTVCIPRLHSPLSAKALVVDGLECVDGLNGTLSNLATERSSMVRNSFSGIEIRIWSEGERDVWITHQLFLSVGLDAGLDRSERLHS